MRYTHLFWDFDGTLYNSYPQISAALLRTLAEYRVPAPTVDDVMPLLKHSVFHAVKHYASKYNIPVEQMMECFRHQHSMETVFPPYDGLGDCLKTLSEAGGQHYLYTHRDLLAIELLEKDGLWKYFTGAVTSCDGFPHKPAPDALLSLLSRYQLDPMQCLMIGDRGIDIESGLNAGMNSAVFDPEGYYFGPKALITAKSMAELTIKLIDA